MRSFKIISMIVSLLIVLGLVGCSTNDPQTNVRFAGYVENTQINVTGRIPGKIMEVLVDEGQTVHEGDVIARLDNREILSNIKALEAQLNNIDKNRKRIRNLFKAGAVSRQKLDEIETAYQVVYNKLQALYSRVEDMEIRAPITGKVIVRVLEPGQMMPPGMPVVIESDTTAIWIRFTIPEKYVTHIQPGQKFELESPTPDEKVLAKVVQIIPMADFATRIPTTVQDERDIRSFSVKMKVIKNQNICKPGMYFYLNVDQLNHGGTSR